MEAARDVLRLPSLGVIPYIETVRDRRGRWVTTVLVSATVIAVVAAVVLAVLFAPPVHGGAEKLWDWIKDLCKNLA